MHMHARLEGVCSPGLHKSPDDPTCVLMGNCEDRLRCMYVEQKQQQHIRVTNGQPQREQREPQEKEIRNSMSDAIVNGVMQCFAEPYTTTMNKSNAKKLLWEEIISANDWEYYRAAWGVGLQIRKKDIEIKLGQMLKLRADIDEAETDEDLMVLMKRKDDYESSIAQWLVGQVGVYAW